MSKLTLFAKHKKCKGLAGLWGKDIFIFLLKAFLSKIRFRFVNWFFSYLFCTFQIICLPNITFYPNITILDGVEGRGRNKQKRYKQTFFVTIWPFRCLDFFAKSDLDLSIDFFRIHFVSFGSFFCQILCFIQS